MPWGKLDDSLYDHPKLDALGPLRLPCVGLWALAISWSNRRLTDGFVPTDRVRRLGGTVKHAAALVDAGLFEPAEGGYQIHDFLQFNDSRADVEKRREAERSKKANQRAAGGGRAVSLGRVDRNAAGQFMSPGDSDGDSSGVSPGESHRASPSTRPGPAESRSLSAREANGQDDEETAVLDAYQAVGGSVRSEKAVAWLYRLVSEHGADPVIRLIGKLAPSVRIEKLIGEVEGALVRGRVDTAKAEDEDQAARARTNRETKAARKLAYLRGEITEAEYDSGMKP